MNTSQMDSEARPRVLIVEPDPELAMALIREGLSLGLEPKLCRGPVVSLNCPGLRGEPCARTERIARFVFTNEGELPHDGDMEAQMDHEAEMAEHMEEDEGAEPGEVEVEPGETASLEYTFSDPGTLLIGCHEPGHWDARMKATIGVEG